MQPLSIPPTDLRADPGATEPVPRPEGAPEIGGRLRVYLAGVGPSPRGWLSRLAHRRDIGITTTEASGLADPATGAIFVAGPPESRPHWISCAVEAAKAILVTIPPVAAAADWSDCLVAAAEADVPFLAAFERRFDRRIQRLKMALSTGKVGRPLSINLRHTAAFEDGTLIEGLLDDLDLARWLAGETPTELYSTIGIDHTAGIVETLSIVLKFDSGAVAVLQRCRRRFENERRQIEVLGSTATLTVVDEPCSGLVCRDADGVYELGQQDEDRPDRIVDNYMDAAVDHFVRALDRDEPHLAGPEDLRVALTMFDAVERSIRTGHAIRLIARQ